MTSFLALVSLTILFGAMAITSNAEKNAMDQRYTETLRVDMNHFEQFHNLEWQRTRPDLRVYIPKNEKGPDAENQHFLVTPTNAGAWIAVWTMATHENHKDQCVVVSRSIDKGKTWTEPVKLDGQEGDNGKRASWGFPFVVPKTNRIYVFYN